MKAVLIGSGNVATVLGRKIKATGNEVLQVLSRQESHARELALELGCTSGDFKTAPVQGADVFIIAIADIGLSSIEKWLNLGNNLVVHTAGSVPMDVLKNVSSSYGVLYPLQSLHKKMEYIPDIPFLINAGNDAARQQLEQVAAALQSSCSFTDDASRLKYHATGVVVNNFPNHLFALVEDFCNKENLDYKILAPLIMETALRATRYAPAEVQTGPALRNDAFIMERHLRAFQEHPVLRTMYIRFTDSIISYYEKKRKG